MRSKSSSARSRSRSVRSSRSRRSSKSGVSSKKDGGILNKTNFSDKIKSGKLKYRHNNVQQYEIGASGPSDAQCVYIGHAIPATYYIYGLCRSILVDLYRATGIDIVDFGDPIPGQNTGSPQNTSIVFKYWDTPTASGVSEFKYNFASSANFEVVVQGLAQLFQTTFVATQTQPKQWESVTLQFDNYTTGGVTNNVARAVIPLGSYKLSIQFDSVLRVQNETLAAVGNTDIEEVSNHPLSGVLLEVNKMNGFVASRRKTTGNPIGNGLLANTSSGLIANTAVGTNGLAIPTAGPYPTQGKYLKPPPATMFMGKVKKTAVSCDPGSIIESKIHAVDSLTFSNFITKFLPFLSVPQVTLINLGQANLFCLEHTLKAGTTDVPISIVYQLDWKLTFNTQWKKSKATPLVTVVN